MAQPLPQSVSSIDEAFALWEYPDSSGRLAFRHVSDILRATGMQFSEMDLQRMLTTVESSDGMISIDQVKQISSQLEPLNPDVSDMIKAVKVVNGGKDSIGAGELKHLLGHVGEGLSDEHIDLLFKDGGVAAGGQVNIEDFLRSLFEVRNRIESGSAAPAVSAPPPNPNPIPTIVAETSDVPSTPSSGSRPPSPTALSAGQQPNRNSISLEEQIFTVEDVGKHNTENDCWVTLGGAVYDVSDYLASDHHPGGKAAILKYAGQDITSVFANNKEHEKDDRQAYNTIEAYRIGILKAEHKAVAEDIKTLESDDLIGPANSPAYRMELGVPQDAESEDFLPKLQMVPDIYAQEFYHEAHLIFFGVAAMENGKPRYDVAVVRRFPDPGLNILKAMKITQKGTQRFVVPLNELQPKKHLHTQIKDWLIIREPEDKPNRSNSWYFVHEHELMAKELRKLEQQHPQWKTAVKFAVLQSTKDHPTGKELSTASEAFTKFLGTLGDKIDLAGWTGYRGDFGKDSTGETYFTRWRDIDLMMHVSTMINAEQHRRLVGNDIAVVFFREESEGGLHADNIDLGTVPQVHCVVQPKKTADGQDGYRLQSFSRTNIKYFGPAVPKDKTFTATEMRDFLFAKIVNGFAAALQCPPMNRLFYRPRGAAIDAIQGRFPAKTDKSGAKAKYPTVETRDRKLVLGIKKGKGLASKDMNGFSDPFMEIELRDVKLKTQIQKKTLDPVWNETFEINMKGVDIDFALIHFVCYDWDRVGAPDFMGEFYVECNKLDEFSSEKGAKWMTLLHRPSDPKEEIKGEVLVSIDKLGEW